MSGAQMSANALVREEEWRPIAGYEDAYEVSSRGRVRGVDRMVNASRGGMRMIRGTVLGTQPDAKGYRHTHLYACGGRKTVKIHRLVARAFLPSQDGKPEINHKDGIKAHNHMENLEWCTHAENIAHAVHHGLTPRGEKSGTAILTESEVRDIWGYLVAGMGLDVIAHLTGVARQTLSCIRSRKSWRHLAPPDTDALRTVLAIPPHRKLTADDVRGIRAMLRDGFSGVAVARTFGVDQTTVSGIKVGDSWRHIKQGIDEEGTCQ